MIDLFITTPSWQVCPICPVTELSATFKVVALRWSGTVAIIITTVVNEIATVVI